MQLKKVSIGVAALLALSTAAACSSSKSGKGNNAGNNGGSNGAAATGVPDPGKQPKSKIKAVSMSGDCASFGKYGKYNGAKVTIYTSITDPELPYHINAMKQFEKCTGIQVQYQGTKDFEGILKTKVQDGNAPDLALFPQPGLLATFASGGKLKPATDALTKEAEQNWVKTWIDFGTVDGVFFGPPVGANLKSLVWYSPKYFKQYGYTVPTTWDDMIKLSDKMAADGHKPWCAGIESGVATGWPATDWMEEVMLRKYGPDVYDQWTQHKIPFNDPKVQDVLKTVGSILRNPKYVNAGIGDVKSIATTAFQKGGLPIESGKCMLHAQANFYAANWDPGTTVAPDGDVFAFYEPPMTDKFGKPIEVGGEFDGAFSDRPEVEAVQLYMASSDWVIAKAKLNAEKKTSGWFSANKNVPLSTFDYSPVDKLGAQLMRDPNSVARFDASDVMPSSVGAGTFWKHMTQWILGNENDKQALDAIEASWPK